MKKILKNILPMQQKNGIMRVKAEVFVNSKNVFFCSLESMQSKHIENDIGYVCQNKQMINIVDAAKYLIQLYYKTGCRYHCTRTKIEKMLSIANLVSLKYGEALFAEKNVVNPCGTGFPVLASFLFGDIVEGREDETCQDIHRELINESAVYPPIYEIENYGLISRKVYQLLLDIFLKFGNYDAKTMGILCDMFKCNIATNEPGSDRKIVNNEAVKPFFDTCACDDRYKNNEIISFIVNYGDIS